MGSSNLNIEILFKIKIINDSKGALTKVDIAEF